MRRTRIGSITLMLTMVLGVAQPAVTMAAKPAAPVTATDITSTSRGVALATETADRFTSYGVATKANDLAVLQYADGTVIVAPEALIAGLSAQPSQDSISATVEVGGTLQSEVSTSAMTTDAAEFEATAATSAYWTVKEQACLASLYVDSARLDSCYYIYQLINDGSTTKNYWTLRMKGTAFEYGSGLHSAWISGERTPNTASQTWVDWAPEQGHDGGCSTVNVGVSYIVNLSYSVTGCEKWIFDKNCNTCSPWIKTTWDCNCWFGLDAKNGTVSRAVAYQMLVSTAQTSTPRFRLGMGMAA